MTICHKRKLIFVHIPKNAGTSIMKSMGVENIFGDKNIEEYKKHYKNYWNVYKKFTVVRDPIDRFISAYKFARMKESGYFSATGQERLEKHHHYDICNKIDINQYAYFLYKNPVEFDRWTIPQTFHLYNEKQQIEIDYVVRFENLLEDLRKININKIEKLNCSKINDDRIIKLTKKSKKILHEIYELDYHNFSYVKDLNYIFDYQ